MHSSAQPKRTRSSKRTGPRKSSPHGDMFEAEAEGLRELAAADAIRVPAVIDCGVDGGTAFIAIERLHFEGPTAAAETALGEQLAGFIGIPKDQHGWHRDNTIGPTPQHNPWSDDWVAFLREHRLGFQLRAGEQWLRWGTANAWRALCERSAGVFRRLRAAAVALPR